MRPEIIARQRQIIAANGLDALIAVSPENFAWTAGFVVPSQPILRQRHAMAVVKADGTDAVVCVDMEETTVRNRLPGVELRVWGEFEFNAMQTLAGLLTDMGLGAARIGIEMDYLPAGDFDALPKPCRPQISAPPNSCSARLRQSRRRKKSRCCASCRASPIPAITDAFAAVAAGSEMDIAAAITRNVYTLGATTFQAADRRHRRTQPVAQCRPDRAQARAQDVCRVEIFSVIDGYHAGVCRTAVVQEAPPNAERIWHNLAACKYLILDMIKPGASCRAIYDAFIEKLPSSNLPPISFVGHGIGLLLHEDPYLGTHARRPNAVWKPAWCWASSLCYRTGYGFGMQNKDMVLGHGHRLRVAVRLRQHRPSAQDRVAR